MLTCCVCKVAIDDPATLFKHLKEDHKIKGKNCEVQCTVRQCWAKFSDFSNFKKHVLRCVAKMPANEEIPEEIVDPQMYVYAIDDDVLHFQEAINTAALDLTCSMCANMNSPRCEVYKTIAAFENKYISKITSGIKEIIIPRVRPEEEEIVNHFIKAVESSFVDVKSESKLDSALERLKLMSPLLKCELFETVKKKQKKPRRKRRRQSRKRTTSGEVFDVDGSILRTRKIDSEDSEDSYDSVEIEVDGAILRKRRNESEDCDDSEEIEENDENEANEEHETNNENSIIKGKVTIMPIEFQIKKFFELPNVFEKVILNTRKLQEGNDLDHFIKGKLWKEKVKNYNPDQLVIPYHFYGDGVQINNPLGPHAKSGDQHLNYYSFPTIPYEYQSRLENIFVAQSYTGKYHQLFSSEKLYNNVIEIFRTLAEDGVILNINDEEIEVFFVCGLYIGNKNNN